MMRRSEADVGQGPGIIAGVVRTDDGRPIPGASVYFIQGPVPLPEIAMLTDEAGGFVMSAPVDGSYEIGARADGFAAGTVTVQVRGGAKAEAEIVLLR